MAIRPFFDRAHNRVEVRPVTGVEFGMEKFAIGAKSSKAPPLEGMSVSDLMRSPSSRFWPPN